MKRTILILIFIVSSIICLSQNRYNKNNERDYSVFTLGADVGFSAILAVNTQDELISKFKFHFGGLFILRPVHFLGLESGFKFHYIIGENKFYDIPLLFHFYNKKDNSFIIGPNLIYDYVKHNTDFSSPDIGATLGFGSKHSELTISWYPDYKSLINERLKSAIILSIKFKIYMGFGNSTSKNNNNYRRTNKYRV
jgi:hypothetical protein